MDLSDLLGRIPAGYGVEMVDRKVIDPKTATVVERTSIDLVCDGRAPLRFSTLDDVSAALDLLAATGKKQTRLRVVPSPAELPLAPVVEPTPAEIENADEDEEDEPETHVDEDEPPADNAPAPPPPRTIAPGGPVMSQFQQRQASRKAKDKTPIPPVGMPASV